MYRHTAVIEFRDNFPFDMLRYDSCFPSTQTDARIIGSRTSEKQSVTVERISREKDPRWTPGRWFSFGATCTPVRTTKLT